MPILSEYARHTPGEQAFAAMLEDYEGTLPEVEVFFDPAQCPEAFLPYLAQSYYADVYSDTLGVAYNRAVLAQAASINQIRGTWGAAQRVAAAANVILGAPEYRRGPGLVVNLRLSTRGAGRIGAVDYGAVWPRGVELPGGVPFRALEIPTAGDDIILHGASDLDEADWPDDGLALEIPVSDQVGRTDIKVLSTQAVPAEGQVTLSGRTATIDLRPGTLRRLRAAAGLGATTLLTIRSGSLPPGTGSGWEARRDAWEYSHPVRNTGIVIRISPRPGLAAADYSQAMARIFSRILPYEVTVNDIISLGALTLSVQPMLIPGAQGIVYQGYQR